MFFCFNYIQVHWKMFLSVTSYQTNKNSTTQKSLRSPRRSLAIREAWVRTPSRLFFHKFSLVFSYVVKQNTILKLLTSLRRMLGQYEIRWTFTLTFSFRSKDEIKRVEQSQPHIQFTFERKTNESVPCLEILLSRNNDNNIYID